MIAPTATSPPPQPTRRAGLTRRAAAAVGIGAAIATLVCASLCAGLALWALPTVQATLNLWGVPVSFPDLDPDDWWADRVLSQVYTAALDATVSDPQVVEGLGEGIGPDILSPILYSRINSGPLDVQGETIEFDIVGSKGNAVVSVVATGAGSDKVHISEITVILPDATTIDVPPPDDQKVQIR